jgi:hypothetical protein
MIKLTSQNDSIVLTNSAPGSIDWVTNWRDEIEEDVRPGSANGHITSATTTTIVAAIAAAVHPVEDRVVESIIITNKGMGSQNIQLLKSVTGGTTYALTEIYALGAGQSLRITEDGQFLNNALIPSAVAGPTGPQGPAGATGAAGADGLTILNGAVDPTTEGVDGDFYINTVSNKIFGPKATTWPAGVSLVGPQGNAGTNGLTILNGASDPTNQGVDGDFFINTVSNKIFGPKATTWPAGVSLVGPQGTQGNAGAAGTNGHSLLFGTAAPTTEGVNGDTYLQDVTGSTTHGLTIYGPKSGGTWPAGVVLITPVN